ncbi:hypothetical protein R2601_03908 [Salipiger bermudensis HTCC2601]|uniref:Uncharacterized protein n=1 Tax=Salipiger bermudensis (strain DSM 26914 / JCM 13377 / KCTC 12554 / HTCC2601) TaxID=314265 RepID=Q0FW64_SALBH|nr:hypothetical protein R2601_03908 [Salipiger bermudensis HTCC2601]
MLTGMTPRSCASFEVRPPGKRIFRP